MKKIIYLQLSALMLISGITRAATIYPQNNGFEVPNQFGGYTYSPSGASWTFINDGGASSGTGIAANGSGFNVSNAPNGNSDGTTSFNGQAAFFQGGNGTLAGNAYFFQSIGGFQAGTASVSFLLESRGPYPMNELVVMLDNTNLGTFSTSSSSDFVSETTISIPVTAGSHTLYFIPDGPTLYQDGFVDSVSISNDVPDNGTTWALLLLGVTATFGLNLLLHKRSEA